MPSTGSDVHALLAAFPDDIPSRAILAAAIEGRSKSRVFTDSADADPVRAGAVIVANKNGTTFIGRGVTQEFLEATLTSQLRKGRVVLTITSRQDSIYDWSWTLERRIYPRYEHVGLDRERVARLAQELPEGRDILPIDKQLFRQCQWQDSMVNMLGSRRRFLQNALGVCQIAGDTIVAEAYAIISDSAGAEIGAITTQAYRRSGNATVTCAFLVAAHLGDHAPIYWCCDQENVASAQTAERLGFLSRREYQFIVIR